MRDDLLDAQAAIDWAVAQDIVLMKRIATWRRDKPYTVRIDTNSEPGKKLYRLTKIKPLDPLIQAEVGAIIHSIRCSLDMLACVLAARNDFPESKSTYFPIWKSESDFLAPEGGKTNPVLEKIKRLSQIDRDIIKGLKPYPGGDNTLVALHDLDLTRKHRRFLRPLIRPRGISIAGLPLGVAYTIDTWVGFDEEAAVGWTDASQPDCNVTINPQITINEAGPVNRLDLRATIREFARKAQTIINLFV